MVTRLQTIFNTFPWMEVVCILINISLELFLRVIMTTRTLEFWGYPMPPHDYPYYWVILDPDSKEDKVKVTNLKTLPKFQFFLFRNKLYVWHLLELLDRMCKYEMHPRNIVEVTERTPFCPQTDGRTDRRTDDVKPAYPPFNFVRGI